MSWLDLLIGLGLFFFLIKGFVKGFFREIFGTLGIVVGVFLAISTFKEVSSLTSSYIKMPSSLAKALTFALILIVTFILFKSLGFLFHKLITSTIASPLERLGGAGFGIIKGCLVVSIILLGLAMIPLPTRLSQEFTRAKLAPFFLSLTPRLCDLVHKCWPGGIPFDYRGFLRENIRIPLTPQFWKD